MAKFTGRKKKTVGAVSTASLPDIVFMLLFFFMVTTVMREVDPLVEVEKPQASEVVKLKKKSLVDYIYIGKAKKTELHGSEPVIQLDDAIAPLSKIQSWVADNVERRLESDRPKVTTSLKVDENVRMKIVTDVKQELRHANMLKINYSANERQRTVSE